MSYQKIMMYFEVLTWTWTLLEDIIRGVAVFLVPLKHINAYNFFNFEGRKIIPIFICSSRRDLSSDNFKFQFNGF